MSYKEPRAGAPFKATLALAAIAVSASGLVRAEPVSFEVALDPIDEIRGEFKDGSNHFVAMLHREGTAEGTGAFDGADVVEYGFHDVDPPHGGQPKGYLEVTTPGGDVAYLRFDVRAVFLGGGEKPRLFDRGIWELVSGTGQFADTRGLGTVIITPGERTTFALDGELAPKP